MYKIIGFLKQSRYFNIFEFLLYFLTTRMLPNRSKIFQSSGGTNKIGGASKPFSILSYGLMGQNKQKNSNKVKQHQEKKCAVMTKPTKIHDENQNYGNFHQSNNQNSKAPLNQKIKDLPVVPMKRENFQSNFFKEDHVFLEQKVVFQEMNSQMIEEAEERLEKLKKEKEKPNEVAVGDEVARIHGGVINLSKKIKKIDKIHRTFHKFEEDGCLDNILIVPQLIPKTEREEIAEVHQNLLRNPYFDSEVIVDASIFRNQIISQRIDNDIDSEEEQINLGLRRLHKSLSDAVEFNKMANQKQ